MQILSHDNLILDCKDTKNFWINGKNIRNIKIKYVRKRIFNI